MSHRRLLPLMLSLVLALSMMACSKDMPGFMKAVPADADIVGSLDAKATIAYAKAAVPKLVPAGMKDQVPTFEVLAKQAMQMAGIDINKLTQVHFIGYVKSEDKMAIIAEGLSTQGMTGEKKGEHKGVALHSVAGSIHYAELKGLGVAAAPSEDMLKKVIDTFNGDAKNIGDGEKGKMLTELLKIEKDLGLMRVYVLTGDMPQAGGAPFKVKGGAMLLDLDKGAALAVLSDKAGVDQIAQGVSMGLMALQTGLMMGGGKDMPMPLDADTKKAMSEFLGKIKTEKAEDKVTISYKGDLKPLIEKAVAMGIKEYEAEARGPAAIPAMPDEKAIPDAPKDAPADPAAPTVQ